MQVNRILYKKLEIGVGKTVENQSINIIQRTLKGIRSFSTSMALGFQM